MWTALPGLLGLGIDLVHVPRIEESLRDFGDAFASRLFTPAEIAYVRASTVDQAQRFAARFAAKEATIKALSLSDAGVNWRDMEVVRAEDGSTTLALRGVALEKANAMGVGRSLVCLSHDGEYAAAVVAALSDKAEPGGLSRIPSHEHTASSRHHDPSRRRADEGDAPRGV
ncbi:MAG: holo-[acyl-carrier-protein] synthase, partial [Comamonadaceae bacterium]